MTLFTRFSILLIVTQFFTSSLAFDEISTPEAVSAGEPFNVTLTTSDFDEGCDNFVVYLAITPPAWGTNPECPMSAPQYLNKILTSFFNQAP